jgi:hypothetical protein
MIYTVTILNTPHVRMSNNRFNKICNEKYLKDKKVSTIEDDYKKWFYSSFTVYE